VGVVAITENKENKLWEAVQGYLDLLDASESPHDPPLARAKIDLPPR
jgi:hypothetical protein